MPGERRDHDLMVMAKRGSRVAFEWLVKRHHGSLVKFFHWRLWEKDLAEDFAQDVFLKLYVALPNYQPRGSFKSYLYSIATNLLIDHIRRQKARPRPLRLDVVAGLDRGDDDLPSLLSRLVSPIEPPDAGLHRAEILDALQTAIADLPDELYVTFVLHRFEDKRYAEIATALGIPLGTVKSRMNSAYLKLREAMALVHPDQIEEIEQAVRAGETRRIRTATRAQAAKRTGSDPR